MSWTDHFPVLEPVVSAAAHAAPVWLKDIWEVERVCGRQAAPHVLCTAITWPLIARREDRLPDARRVAELIGGKSYGPLNRAEKWLRGLGQLIRTLRARPKSAGVRLYLATELSAWAEPVAAAGGEAVVMAGSGSLPPVPGLWQLLALEEDRLVTVVAPSKIREAARWVDLTERMQAAGLCFWREPGYGAARTRDMTDYRPILNTAMGCTGGIPVREFLLELESALSAGQLRAECRAPGGKVRPLAGTLWPQVGYDEWFLMAAIYPRAAHEGMLTLLSGQRLSPTLLALDIEYATWANPAAAVITPRMGEDWPLRQSGNKATRQDAGVTAALRRISGCPIINTAGLTVRHPLPDHAWRDEGMSGMIVDPGVASWFNPACIRWRGHRWLAYRTECQPMWKWGRVSLARLNEGFEIIEGSNQLLTLRTSFGDWCAEDPRLFVHQDRLFLYYTDHWAGGLAEILEDGGMASARLFPFETEAGKQLRSRHDKNWGFFSFNDRLFAVYWIHPHVVREVNLDAWQFGREWRMDWDNPLKLESDMHGGSSPVEHDGLMWRIVHHHHVENAAPNGGRCYALWLMAFEPSPPFKPRWFCTRSILRGERMPETPLLGWRDWLVTFCSSLERIPGGWRFFFGHNDRRMRWGEISDEEIGPWLSSL